MKQCLVFLVQSYRILVSPILPMSCRFYPSCSEYSIQALQRYGVIRGLFLTSRRICRCHPLCQGGYDPLP